MTWIGTAAKHEAQRYGRFLYREYPYREMLYRGIHIRDLLYRESYRQGIGK